MGRMTKSKPTGHTSSFASSKPYAVCPRDIFRAKLAFWQFISFSSHVLLLILKSRYGVCSCPSEFSSFLAMESLINASSAAIVSSSSSFPISSPNRILPLRSFQVPHASKGNENESDSQSDSKNIRNLPILSKRHLSLSPLSKDVAMGVVLSAATGRGWTTGSGMEGPSAPAGLEAKSGTENVSTFPWSLFTKSPRRRMLVAFTCNICGQRTTRAINPHAYTDGTVFVQCCGCHAYHKLVDNLNLFHEMKCYVNPSFNYGSNGWDDVNFKYLDIEDGSDDTFPIP